MSNSCRSSEASGATAVKAEDTALAAEAKELLLKLLGKESPLWGGSERKYINIWNTLRGNTKDLQRTTKAVTVAQHQVSDPKIQ